MIAITTSNSINVNARRNVIDLMAVSRFGRALETRLVTGPLLGLWFRGARCLLFGRGSGSRRGRIAPLAPTRNEGYDQTANPRDDAAHDILPHLRTSRFLLPLPRTSLP